MVLDGGKEAIYLAGNKKGKTVQYSYHDFLLSSVFTSSSVA